MYNLFKHQEEGAVVLCEKEAYLLAWEMGCGKSRAALHAAFTLYKQKKIDRILVLCPAAVKYAWGEELGKLALDGAAFTFVTYQPKDQRFTALMNANQGGGKLPPRATGVPICIISYALLQQKRHVEAIAEWCKNNAALIADESSFLKNRTAEQTRGAMKVAHVCTARWLLSGTPIANSPLDLWAQSEVMQPVRMQGPLRGFGSYYHFRATYGILGGFKNKQVIAFKNLDKLQKQFAPFVSRLEKKDCLDLPEKLYTVREVPLSTETWRLYQELRHDALMTLSEDDVQVEPNAAVRLMRLCQLTSGHYGGGTIGSGLPEVENETLVQRDISSEKIDWLVDAILDGELKDERAIIVWCRWRRERERLAGKIAALTHRLFRTLQIFGGQSQKERNSHLGEFQSAIQVRRVLLAQPHAGGYGLNLTAAHCAVYMSNDFSFTTRVQSEDRCHRVGQRNAVTYIDVVATGPDGQRTVDSHILKALKAKESIATWTCAAWRRALS